MKKNRIGGLNRKQIVNSKEIVNSRFKFKYNCDYI